LVVLTYTMASNLALYRAGNHLLSVISHSESAVSRALWKFFSYFRQHTTNNKFVLSKIFIYILNSVKITALGNDGEKSLNYR